MYRRRLLGGCSPEIHYGFEFETTESGNQTLETKKGWMVKGGKKEPSTRSLYRLKGIKNADPLSESPGRGSMDGKGGKGNHPSISKKYMQS
jgi:hypothetical protein